MPESTQEPTVAAAQVTLEDGHAFAPAFGDIYATRSGAFGQAMSVFLADGVLQERWQKKDQFTILENGFGLGTNFLVTLATWRKAPGQCKRLDYVAIERYPVSARELIEFAAPEVSQEALELSAQWPDCLPGFHTLYFDEGRVRLTLVFHDSEFIAPKLHIKYDALFLDGFSPSKNPQMWSEKLLRTLARYAAEGATVTTWCTRSSVREVLAHCGFAVEKKKGYGQKRERLLGVMVAKRNKGDLRQVKDVIVVGAGLAGANVAYQLARAGVRVRVVDEAVVPGAAASALCWGILHPHYSRDDNLLSRLSREGFLTTRALINSLQAQTGQRLLSATGCLQMAHSDEIYESWCEARDQHLPFALPATYAELLDAKSAGLAAGLELRRGGWLFHKAGMVRAGALCRTLVEAAAVSYRGNTTVAAVEKTEAGWLLRGCLGEVIDEAQDVVICAANHSAQLTHALHLGLEPLPGRITLLRDIDLAGLKMPVSGEGYITRMDDGYVSVGATYELPATQPWEEVTAHEDNLQKLSSLLMNCSDIVVTGSYQGVRAAGLGRLPAVGPVCDEVTWLQAHDAQPSRFDFTSMQQEGLWVCAGLGSRGLSFSARSAEILASLMTATSVPADKSLLLALSPERGVRAYARSNKAKTGKKQ